MVTSCGCTQHPQYITNQARFIIVSIYELGSPLNTFNMCDDLLCKY